MHKTLKEGTDYKILEQLQHFGSILDVDLVPRLSVKTRLIKWQFYNKLSHGARTTSEPISD